MPKAIDYQFTEESQISNNNQSKTFKRIFPIAFAFLATIFSAIVTVLNYYFPRSLDGTYLKLLF